MPMSSLFVPHACEMFTIPLVFIENVLVFHTHMASFVMCCILLLASLSAIFIPTQSTMRFANRDMRN